MFILMEIFYHFIVCFIMLPCVSRCEDYISVHLPTPHHIIGNNITASGTPLIGKWSSTSIMQCINCSMISDTNADMS